MHPIVARVTGLLRQWAIRLTRIEGVRRIVFPIMLRFPAFGARVSRAVAAMKDSADLAAAQNDVPVPEELRHLSEPARKVLADLRRPRRPLRRN